MSSYRLRELRDGDAEAVAAIFVEAYGDARPLDAEEILSWRRNAAQPGLLQVLEVDGRVYGYGDLAIHDDEVELCAAAPGHWDAFLDWAEERARTTGASRTRICVPAGHDLAAVGERRGYRLWRSAYTMELALENTSGAQPPSGIEVRAYEPVDEASLREALNEIFAPDPFYDELSADGFQANHLNARGRDASLWLLALDGDGIAGFVLAYPVHDGNPLVGAIRPIGVVERWRNRGLGTALLQMAFAELCMRGLRTARLGVDAENATGAVRLYEKAGMHVALRWDNWVLDR